MNKDKTAEHRKAFESWLLNSHGLTDTWQPERNCYKTYGVHLAWKAWQQSKIASKLSPLETYLIISSMVVIVSIALLIVL